MKLRKTLKILILTFVTTALTHCGAVDSDEALLSTNHSKEALRSSEKRKNSFVCDFDWNNDGVLDNNDAIYGGQYIIGLVDTIYGTTDIDGNGQFNVGDAATLSEFLLGLITVDDLPQCTVIVPEYNVCDFDWNNDGVLDNNDAIYGGQYIVGLVDTIYGTTDIDGNGQFNVGDAATLSEFLLGLITVDDLPQCTVIVPEYNVCDFDWNNDGMVDLDDLYYGSDYILGLVDTISGTTDIDESGSFSATDLNLLNRYLLHGETIEYCDGVLYQPYKKDTKR